MDHPVTTQWAPWLLRARVTPPRDLQQHIARPRVLEALTNAAEAPIVVLDAPPGFGKTAALVEWSAALTHRSIRTAWLTLDATDDPESVLRYLAFAFHNAGLDVSGTAAAGEAELPSHKWSRELQLILARVERGSQRWVLVIDDLDTAPAAVLEQIVSPLLRFAPPSLTLVLVTRAPLGLDLSGPESRALVRRIGRRELRFEREEIRMLWGRSATAAQIRAVERRTEGWPALVQFSATADTTHWQNFFEFRVLQRLDADSRDLVRRLALLPSFTVDVIVELTGLQTAGMLIDTLNGIVRAMEGGGARFTMHPLFREYVASQFAAAEPHAAAQLRYVAAGVYGRLGLHAEAVQIAVETGDADFIGKTVDACNPVLTWIRHGTARLRPLVRNIPHSVLISHPRAGYGRVIYWVKEGRLRDAQSLFDRLENLPASETHTLDRALCHCMLAVYKGTPITNADVANLERLSLSLPELAPMLGCLTNTLHCYLQQHAGQFAAAQESARRAIRDAELAKSPYGAFFEYCDLAMIAAVLGDAPKAFTLFQQGERACRATVRADERLALIRDAFRLEIEHEINPLDVTEMPRLRNLFLRLPRLEAWLDVFAAVYRTYSEKLLLLNDLTAALAVIDAGLGHVREQEIENVATILLCQRAYLLACAGNTAASQAILNDLPNRLHSWRETEAFVEAQAMQNACNALPLLKEAIKHAQHTGNVRSELRFRRLRMKGKAHDDDLARVAELEASSGFTRGLIFTTRQPDALTPDPQPGAALFTPREMGVLEKLEEGLTDKSIALALGITAHGVRHHLKRIYVKLNVRDRAEARERHALIRSKPH